MKLERKEEYIESEILSYFLERGCRVSYKNDIKGFYNASKGFYQKNKSPFIRNGISDITVLKDGKYIAIEVKKPSEMKYFDVTLEESKQRYIKAEISSKNLKKAKHAFEQNKFLEDIRSEGGIGFFASSVNEVIQRLEENCIRI